MLLYQGNDINAIEVFKIVLAHMKRKILKDIKRKKVFDKPMTNQDVQWIITVPAIWSDFSRNFMRQAAERAGFIPEKTRLVVEPEAASAFVKSKNIAIKGNACRAFYWRKVLGTLLLILGEGHLIFVPTRFLIIEELLKYAGHLAITQVGRSLTKSYLIFWFKLYGRAVADKFKTDNRLKFFDLLRDFENKKNTFINSTQKIVIDVGGLSQLYQDKKRESIGNA
ncbi:hypothetical protein DPMN_177628 [Dreissena polymorpha]|uniref:Uncharacterized protein n=1 Tax=Dreissena polymorpha TaxID=45954 RepID=A0A9D4IKD0_DREPO|nr:hypothetical protein DPMN_177628 [Dreissena polymorpha]